MNIYQKINNNENILLIFGGFASHPSHFLPFVPKSYDSIVLFSYRHLDFDALQSYLKSLNPKPKITLLGFSMGVFVARVFLESLEQDSINFARKIAINGTEFGIHSQFGIPLKIFKLTQKTFDLEAFKRNLFEKSLPEAQHFTFLDSQTLREELGFFIQSCAQFDTIRSEIVWDEIIISKHDLIFSPQAQKSFWIDFKNSQAQILELNAPHFAFFDWQL